MMAVAGAASGVVAAACGRRNHRRLSLGAGVAPATPLGGDAADRGAGGLG